MKRFTCLSNLYLKTYELSAQYERLCVCDMRRWRLTHFCTLSIYNCSLKNIHPLPLETSDSYQCEETNWYRPPLVFIRTRASGQHDLNKTSQGWGDVSVSWCDGSDLSAEAKADAADRVSAHLAQHCLSAWIFSHR